nr:hypothetical protein [Tanacetum cinerariifolium]
MDDLNITMEQYIQFEEEKACRRGQVYNWETATYGKIWYDEDIHHLRYFENEFPAIVYKDALISEQEISSKPTVGYFNDFDYFKDFENEFPAIAYNDALTSKFDFSEPTVSPQRIDKFDETSLSECDDEGQNVIYFNDLFPFNVIYPDDLSDTDNDNDKIDIEHSSRDLSIKPFLTIIKIDAQVVDIATCLCKSMYSMDEWEVDRYRNANLGTEEPHPLSPTSAPPSADYTHATLYTDNESKSFETSETRVTSSPSATALADCSSPPSPHRPLLAQTSPTSTPPRSFYYHSTARMAVHTQPTQSFGYSAKLTEVMTLSPSSFRKRGTSELIADTETERTESEDEDIKSEDQETTSEGQQQQAIPAEDTAEDEPLGLGYTLRSLERGHEDTGITIGTLWRLILAPKAWAGHTDRGALWQARYEDRREIYDLRRQHTADQREMQELKDRITILEQMMDCREE